MHTHLPKKINPWQLANHSGQLKGVIELASMPRLTQLLNSADGVVTVSLKGGVDEQSTSFLAGTLETNAELICQRCLQTFTLPLVADFCLGLVRSENQINQLSKQYEPLLVAEELELSELCEDELLLALPIIARHPEVSSCEKNGYSATDLQSADSEAAGAGDDNPFAILSTLLKEK